MLARKFSAEGAILYWRGSKKSVWFPLKSVLGRERETAKPATRKVTSRLCENTVSESLKTGGQREAGLVPSAERKAGAESERRGEIQGRQALSEGQRWRGRQPSCCWTAGTAAELGEWSGSPQGLLDDRKYGRGNSHPWVPSTILREWPLGDQVLISFYFFLSA